SIEVVEDRAGDRARQHQAEVRVGNRIAAGNDQERMRSTGRRGDLTVGRHRDANRVCTRPQAAEEVGAIDRGQIDRLAKVADTVVVQVEVDGLPGQGQFATVLDTVFVDVVKHDAADTGCLIEAEDKAVAAFTTEDNRRIEA